MNKIKINYFYDTPILNADKFLLVNNRFVIKKTLIKLYKTYELVHTTVVCIKLLNFNSVTTNL